MLRNSIPVLDRSEQWLRRYRALWQWPLLLLVALLVLAACYTLAVSFWRGPFRDFWEALPFVQRALAGTATLAEYWDQYGYSHRPLLTRWLWVQDYRWAAGSNHLLLGVSLLMQALVFALVYRNLRRYGDIDRRLHGVVLAGVLLCLCSVTQLFNLLHTFDVQWFMTTGFVVWSLERVVAGSERAAGRALVWAWLLVLAASLNNFSALVIWPVNAVVALATGYRRSDVALFVAATALYLLVYFHQLPTGGGDIVAAVRSGGPWVWLQAVMACLVIFPSWYLANPLSFQWSQEGPLQMPWPVSWLPPLLIGLLLLYALWLALCVWRRRMVLNRTAWFGLALVAYGYGVAVVTSIGRGLFWDNVYALRYQNIVLLFWIGMLLLLVANARRQHLAALAASALLLLVLAANAGWYHDFTLKTGNRTRDAHLALRVGLETALPAIQATVSRSHLIEDTGYNLAHEAAFLRGAAAGMYADPAWRVPALPVLQPSPDCLVNAVGVDVHGDDYARLGLSFAEPVDYELIVWFDRGDAPGLLIASREDRFFPRFLQSLRGFTDYAGFALALPERKPEQLYARSGAQWCHLRVSSP